MHRWATIATTLVLTTSAAFAQARGDSIHDRDADESLSSAAPTAATAVVPSAPVVEHTPWDRHVELAMHGQLQSSVGSETTGAAANAMLSLGYAPIPAFQLDFVGGYGIGGPVFAFDLRPRLVLTPNFAVSLYAGLSGGGFDNAFGEDPACETSCLANAGFAGWFNIGTTFEYRSDDGFVFTSSIGTALLLGTAGATCLNSGGVACAGPPETPSSLLSLDLAVGYAF